MDSIFDPPAPESDVERERSVLRAPEEPRPLCPFVVVPRSVQIQAAEDDLERALTATVGGTRPVVSVAEVQDYLRRRFALNDDEFDVKHHYPEDFVVRFRHGVDRQRVLESRRSGVWLPLIWNPWRRTTEGHLGRFRFKVVVALSGVPLHARNLDVAQRILGSACGKLEFSSFRDRPDIDDREFFVSACCWHPRFIHAEQVICIPEPHIPGVLPPEAWAQDAHLPGLRYRVRARLVAYQDWASPPGSPGHGGGFGDRDRGDDGEGRSSGGGDSEVDDHLCRRSQDQSCGLCANLRCGAGPSNAETTQPSVRVGDVLCPVRAEREPMTPPMARLASSSQRVLPPTPLLTPLRHASPARGLVGQVLAVAPILLHGGGTFRSPPQPGVDWWAELIDSEVAPLPSCTVVACGLLDPGWGAQAQEAMQQEPNQQRESDAPSVPVSSTAVLGAITPPCGASGALASKAGTDDPATPAALIRDMEDRLCLPLQSPLLQGPPRLRKTKTPAPTMLRRSARLARTTREPDCTVQARVVLLKKLGLQPPEQTSLGAETVTLCRKIFQNPLSDACHDNLKVLLGGRFDPIAMNLNMLGLDEEAPLN